MIDERNGGPVRCQSEIHRLIPALLIPFLAFGLQWFFWSAIQPYVWFLFYPAVFFSSWIGGMRAGLATTAVSTLLVWWFFVPKRYSFQLEHPSSLISIGVFAGMGVLFSLTHARLKEANRQAAGALTAVNAAKEHLEERISERTADLARTIEALQESEAKYRQTLDSMLEGCQIIGFDWRYIYLNDTADRHNRRPRGELLGKTVMECWPGITSTEVFALEKRCMEQRTTHRLDNQFVFPDGHSGWYRLIIQPVKEGIAIFSEDITERKRAEEAFRRVHERLRSFVDANIVGIVIATPSGDVIEANEYYLRTIGYTREEFDRGMVDWRAVTPPEWLHADEQAIRELRERGACTPYEKEYLRRDGTRVSVYLSNAMLPGAGEQIAAFVLDITERKQTEQEVIKLNSRLRHLISSIKELSSAHTLESVQHIVSVSARKLTGADGATMVFREGEFCYYADEDAVEPLWKGRRFPLAACISGWVMINGTAAIVPDIYADERIPLEVYKPTFVKSLAMIPVNSEQPVAAIGNYWRDYHTPSAMEIQLLQTLADAAARAVENVSLLSDLEQRVGERTAQLEAVNRELESFSYSVSHDLKAPLRGIDGYSRLLEEDYRDRLDPEALCFIGNIRQGAAQMHQLIEDLLNYSRMERRSLQSVSLDLPTLVRTVVAERAAEVEQSGTLLRVDIPPLSVRVDREGLAMVLRNLLENALKFSRGATPPSIEIDARPEGDRALLRVRDNGIGFDMRFHDRIFDIFQRLQRSEEYPGTGVGLALVRKAMQRMGGRVWAESSPGKGAIFYLEIPT